MYFAKLDPQIRDHVVSMSYDRFRDVALKANEHWFARKSTNIDSVAKVSWAAEVDDLESHDSAAHSIHALEEYCYYHRVWGKEAQNCRAPCRFQKKMTSSSTSPKAPKNVNKRRKN